MRIFASLANGCTEGTFAAGSAIFDKGDKGSTMYIIVSGDVNIFLPDQASRRVSLSDMARGEYFGEMALFDDLPRSASALATTDAVLLELSRAALLKTVAEHPSAALAMLRTMSLRVRNMNNLLEKQATRNAIAEFESRLAWSDRLADKVAEVNGSWTFIIGLALLTVVWVIINSPGLVGWRPFDEYPFVFFNLVLAVLVGIQGPLILMSQNREGAKERDKAELDFTINLKNEVNIQTLVRELGEFRSEAMHRLEHIDQTFSVRSGIGPS